MKSHPLPNAIIPYGIVGIVLNFGLLSGQATLNISCITILDRTLVLLSLSS